MAAAVVSVRGEAGQRPDASDALKFWVLWDPAPATVSSRVIAMCWTQAEADAVAGLHLT